MDSLYIVIPAYNEAENIATTIKEWYEIIEKYNSDGRSRLVIVDDGSSDETLEICENEKIKREFLEVISKKNGGHGSSIYAGYKYALEKGAEYIFQTDSDGQTFASEFEQFYEARKEYDVQIGNRKRREDGIARVVISAFVRLVVLIIFKVRVEDVNTPYRLMKAESLKVAMDYIPEGYSLTNIALTGIWGKMAKGKINNNKRINMRFVPISFRPRQGGINSINPAKIVRIGIRALSDLSEINRKVGK